MTATNTATKATKPLKQPNPMPQPTVADYIVRRLAREGITDCFGVAGDFAFKLCDAVAQSETIRWIGCSNELDAKSDRKSTRLNSSHRTISYAVFCLKKKKKNQK